MTGRDGDEQRIGLRERRFFWTWLLAAQSCEAAAAPRRFTPAASASPFVRWPDLPLLACLGLVLPVIAAEASVPDRNGTLCSGVAGPALTVLQVAENASQAAMVRQKLQLIESYLKSDVARNVAAAGDSEAQGLLQEIDAHLADGRKALAAGDVEQADAAAMAALRAASSASRLAARSKPPETREAAAERFAKLRAQIGSFLRSLSQEAAGSGQASADPALSRIDALTGEAASYAQSGDYDRANALLVEAYRTTIVLVAEQRRGQTMTAHLVFETPEDELAYERRRHDSYQMLIELMIGAEPELAGSLRPMADRHLGESLLLRQRADEAAAGGQVQTAIATMERATGLLAEVLRMGGLPVFE